MQSQHVPAGNYYVWQRSLGSKAYLAIGGNWHVPKAVSACTVVREQLVGWMVRDAR